MPNTPNVRNIIQRVLLITNGDARFGEHLVRLHAFVAERGITPYIATLHPYAGGAAILPAEAASCDCALVLGGDGMLLHTAHTLTERGLRIPILGINHGRLGFLTALDGDDYDGLAAIVDGAYALDERQCVAVAVYRAHEVVYSGIALNDVVVHRGGSARLLSVEVSVGGSAVYDYRADGVIIATPTGSTAYSLSCGGPIVEPSMPAAVITPVCPHALGVRSLVVSLDTVVSVRLTHGMEPRLTADGIRVYALEVGDTVHVTRGPRVAFMRPTHYSFYKRVAQKFIQT